MELSVEIIDDLMCLMDADGHGIDGARLTCYRDAKRQINEWLLAGCIIDTAAAYAAVKEYFDAMDEEWRRQCREAANVPYPL